MQNTKKQLKTNFPEVEKHFIESVKQTQKILEKKNKK